MKKILVIHTGGTIGSTAEGAQRNVCVDRAKKILFANFSKSDSPCAHLADFLLEEAPPDFETLSENMTVEKWNRLLAHMARFSLDAYQGVIVLHGTDTLAYTAALLSFALSDSPVPVMLVAGDKPPASAESNANANFAAAVELIVQGIAPNVYVPYRNGDGIVYLHIGATLLPCPPFSDDFKNADAAHCFPLSHACREAVFEKCRALSQKRAAKAPRFDRLPEGGVLAVFPHVGLSYARVSTEGIRTVLHATYHAGTVCVQGESTSFLAFAARMKQSGIPLFLAACFCDDDKYSSTAEAVAHGAVPLAMTAEAAYVKLHLALALGLDGDGLTAFMRKELACEFVKKK